ncbi:hypothetical protein E2562_034905 [Oryza meyeriana var. granulata]|uniref:Uncharacterized protein n=1 Tax=Oryza meyeriana var. granulata TaxID=110450 RepID=A0A6G1E912_9ORYZ|nr:hypothetical protein E2562_034905 [Oryza meyeriana var. granulata]
MTSPPLGLRPSRSAIALAACLSTAVQPSKHRRPLPPDRPPSRRPGRCSIAGPPRRLQASPAPSLVPSPTTVLRRHRCVAAVPPMAANVVIYPEPDSPLHLVGSSPPAAAGLSSPTQCHAIAAGSCSSQP